MASSSQQVCNKAQFNDKEKAAISEEIKKATSLLAKNIKENLGENPLAHVVGAINNRQNRGIMLYDSCNFRGNFVTEPLKTIDSFNINADSTFLHKGSKAGVKYGHFDKLPNPLGYVLTWDNPDDARAPKKVFVLAGPRDKIMATEWCEIEQKLDASGSMSHYPEVCINLLAYANIKDLGDKLVVLGAMFYDGFTLQP